VNSDIILSFGAVLIYITNVEQNRRLLFLCQHFRRLAGFDQVYNMA